ncbi:MAG: GAF domain-containing sensor histidine kinase [Acidimicrobiales bacterium]
MATTIHPTTRADNPPRADEGPSRAAPLIAGVTAVVVAAAAPVVAHHAGDLPAQVLRAALVGAWAVAGAVITVRRRHEPLGPLVVAGSLVAAVADLAAAALRAHAHGSALAAATVTATRLVLPLAVAVLPAIAMHVLLSLPDGSCALSRAVVRGAYGVGAVIGVGLWLQRPTLALWPVALEGVVAVAVGLAGSNRRYRRSVGAERQRLQWFGWAMVVTAEATLVTVALRLLAGWPPQGLAIVAAATVVMPVALAISSSSGLLGRIDHLLAHTVSVAGLSGVVVGTYVVVVLGLGRTPTASERSLLLLSMLAAAVAALLYLPARERLGRFSNRLVYGEREAPDEVLRTFGTRLSRAIPLDELLLQVAESLRKSMALSSAEVWTGSGGQLERVVSVPDAPAARLTMAPDEEAVVARAGVSGQAWVKVWLAGLLGGREDIRMRVAPATHSGQLLGLIVAVRPDAADAFRPEDETVLAELARQVGLALHNVALDSALQASLDEVRRQAEELRASRARVVAASDAARRQIERNLHDGAQQHLVALAVNLRLVAQLADADPAAAKEMLAQLGHDVADAVQELRSLAHGIYPPLLVDRGLAEALAAAAGRAALPTEVEAAGTGRYPQDVEAAVYFCCLEALQNAGKHAGEGATAKVRVWEEAGGLLFEVADDGAGFDTANRASLGAGFVNMGDRVGAIGGSVGVESSPGKGTRVSGRLPLG